MTSPWPGLAPPRFRLEAHRSLQAEHQDVRVFARARTAQKRDGLSGDVILIEAHRSLQAEHQDVRVFARARTAQNRDGLSGDVILIEAQHPIESYSPFDLTIRRDSMLF